jgi:hypothetical protein
MNLVVAEDQRRRNYTTAHDEEGKSAHVVKHKDEGDFGWLSGRRVLIVGDGLDRLMIKNFYDEVNGNFQQEWHIMSTCEIASFNTTFVHWHIVSLFNYTPPWWEEHESAMKHVVFEDWYEHSWKPSRQLHLRGLNGRGPALILWQSGLWDQIQFLSVLAKSRYGQAYR